MADSDIDAFEVNRQLNELGFWHSRTSADERAMNRLACFAGAAVGATTIGAKALHGQGDNDPLLNHTEGLLRPEAELLRYFALGCLIPSANGGATLLFDGRKAATIILDEFPELSSIKIRYRSTLSIYEGQAGVHALIANDPVCGSVLRYRSFAGTNDILTPLPPDMSAKDYYSIMEQVLKRAMIAAWAWAPGDFLLVNNRCMVHGREPYAGERLLLRYRYDDPNFKTLEIERNINEE